MNARAMPQLPIWYTPKGIQLFARSVISPKMLVLLFSLLFLKIFKQGYYVYSRVRALISYALMTGVVMVVQLMLTLKLFKFDGKSYPAKPYDLNIWQFQCFDGSQRCLELLRIRFLSDLGNLHLKTLL